MISDINWIIIAVLLGIIIAMILPKKLHFALNGLILFSVGVVHLLYELRLAHYTFYQYPLMSFIVAFVLASTSEELIAESIREKGLSMKGITFFTGIILISLVLIPELYKFGIINFNFPEYPTIVNAIIYMFGGMIAVIAPFFAND